MADQTGPDCKAEFSQAMPERPWSVDTPASKFEPLINQIEMHTQSDMFRRVGKYEPGPNDDDIYSMAHDLKDQNQPAAQGKFDSGVTYDLQQVDGWPTRLILEDKSAHLKETVDLNPTTHNIVDDKVEFCGASRFRAFGEFGEKYRAYDFPGGKIERADHGIVFKPE